MRVHRLVCRVVLPLAMIAAPAFAQEQMPEKPAMPEAPALPSAPETRTVPTPTVPTPNVPTIGGPISEVPVPPATPEAAPVPPAEPQAQAAPAPAAAEPLMAQANYPRCSATLQDQCIQGAKRMKRKKR
jgi:hypothetical protein